MKDAIEVLESMPATFTGQQLLEDVDPDCTCGYCHAMKPEEWADYYRVNGRIRECPRYQKVVLSQPQPRCGCFDFDDWPSASCATNCEAALWRKIQGYAARGTA